MTLPYHALLAAALLTTSAVCAAGPTNAVPSTNTASAATNLLPEGTFELLNAEGDPEGWVLPDKNDRPWQAGVMARVEQENGNHYVRINTSVEYPGFYSLFFAIPWLPDGKTRVRVTARQRAHILEKPDAPWRGYRVHVGFAREQGSGRKWDVEGDRRLEALDVQDTTADWVQATDARTVPEGTKFVCIRVLVGGMVGTFDLDDVVVTAE